jgi:hypothetical protein
MARCGCAGATGTVGVADTDSVDLSLLNGVIRGNVILDPAGTNLLEIGPAGLMVDCADVAACIGGAAAVTVADSPGIDFTSTGSGTVGDPRVISGDLKGVFYQTTAVTFARSLVGVNDVFEQVTELPPLVLATPGLYIVTMDVHGAATITTAGPGVPASATVSAQMRRDGVLVPNTETRVASVVQGNNPTAEPALGMNATGSATRAVQSDGTTAVTVWASRNVSNLPAGSTALINSAPTGRTRITAWRIGD